MTGVTLAKIKIKILIKIDRKRQEEAVSMTIFCNNTELKNY